MGAVWGVRVMVVFVLLKRAFVVGGGVVAASRALAGRGMEFSKFPSFFVPPQRRICRLFIAFIIIVVVVICAFATTTSTLSRTAFSLCCRWNLNVRSNLGLRLHHFNLTR